MRKCTRNWGSCVYVGMVAVEKEWLYERVVVDAGVGNEIKKADLKL